jgi:uncharacterized protein (UPF0548 family)
MFSLKKPSDNQCAAFRIKQSLLKFSYTELGMTREAKSAPGYDRDHVSIVIGQGNDDFEHARKAVCAWKQFPAGWTFIDPLTAAITPGRVVTMRAYTFGLWTLNACRIVYKIEEPKKFGFAYGTLPGHVEQGEELFLVELHDDNRVTYSITAISKPRHFLCRLGYPLARLAQARFRKESGLSMLKAMQEERTPWHSDRRYEAVYHETAKSNR